ncbi:hypothetical protein BDC45DRAFT_141397 [Circinella umbellata]|nr:hypothetical protein BDC45DRAFT_141397 [Circinella umbellata]
MPTPHTHIHTHIYIYTKVWGMQGLLFIIMSTHHHAHFTILRPPSPPLLYTHSHSHSHA